VLSRLALLSTEVEELADDIRTMSHDLFSPRLKLLKVDEALKGLCEEVSTQLNLDIEFSSHDIPSAAESEASLCMFRVLQEALNNAGRHSGSRRVQVELWGAEEALHLKVRDFGAGFDVRAALNAGRGLGLITMRERVGMMAGAFEISS